MENKIVEIIESNHEKYLGIKRKKPSKLDEPRGLLNSYFVDKDGRFYNKVVSRP